MKSIIQFFLLFGFPFQTIAYQADITDISHLISKDEFSRYANVADFIDNSPKVTIVVPSEKDDIVKYGENVVKTLTGFDCDRDGKMDDNATCNAIYFKLWLKYKR